MDARLWRIGTEGAHQLFGMSDLKEQPRLEVCSLDGGLGSGQFLNPALHRNSLFFSSASSAQDPVTDALFERIFEFFLSGHRLSRLGPRPGHGSAT